MKKERKPILKNIIRVKEDLPKQQKKLCDYILENYQTIGLPSIAELAVQARVGTTTVMRVMRALGYQSYNEMKKDLHKLSIHSTHNTWWHMEKSFKTVPNNNDQDKLYKSWHEMM